MITRQRIVTFGIPTAAAATIALAAGLTPWAHDRDGDGPGQVSKPRPDPGDQHQIDVVFAVDTTGSMGGLIDGAKRTVWSIASHIRKTDPNADLRIGLVAYRDVGDDYITRDFSLTNDLDSVFVELSGYRAAGGGDTPEDVDAALDVALHKMQWREGAKKLVFVVGDAPPASRGDVPTFDVLAREAGERQIVLNTIRCGWDQETASSFQQIASLGHGEFSTIQQDGGVQQVATPYDAKMAELSETIDRTTVIVGDEGARHRYEAKMAVAAEAAPAAKADRAEYYAAKPGAPRDDGDLVGGVASGTVDLDGVKDSELPSDFRGMDKTSLKNELAKRAETRKAAQKEIEALSKKRTEYLSTKTASKPDGFDAAVKATVEKQLK